MLESLDLRIVNKLMEADGDLFEYVDDKVKRVIPMLDSVSTIFKEYTDHSSQHSTKVLQLAELLLYNNFDSLSKWDLAVLILAIYHHDVGMFCTEEQICSITSSQEYKKLSPYLKDNILSINQIRLADRNIIDYHMQLEFLRRIHGNRSYQWIKEIYSKEIVTSWYKGFYIWDAVANACVGHCLYHDDLSNIDYSTKFPIGNSVTIDLLFLTCILRLSDICHLSRDRALPYIRQTMNFYSDKSKFIWKTYGDVADTIPLKEGNVISIYASCMDYFAHRAILSSAKDIENELLGCHHLLARCGSKNELPWKYIDTSNVKVDKDADYLYTTAGFNMDFNRVTELLIGSRLYRDRLYGLRECIQNSLDAISVYKMKDNTLSPFLVLDYQSNSNNPIIDIYDNGTGMDYEICSRYLLSIGSRSFWFSERSYIEWGDVKRISIIASHGIGFLSTFMIADSVEVFSKYYDSEPVHLYIDSYKTGVVFKKTNIAMFPNWSLEGSISPWNQGHGTCIRLHLRNPISKLDLLKFLVNNILRPQVDVSLIYDHEYIKLPPIWREIEDKEIENPNLNEVFNVISKEPERDFYSNPPLDASLNRDVVTYKTLRGKIFLQLSISNQRLSQKGILIAEGHDYINEHPLMKYLSVDYDIDISSRIGFELDAERTRIIDTASNEKIRNRIVRILLKEFLKSVKDIESTLYFPCGREWYHGAIERIKPEHKEELEYVFHDLLNKFFTRENTQNYRNFGTLQALQFGKFYNMFSNNKNKSVAINDLLNVNDPCTIFIFFTTSNSKVNLWLKDKQLEIINKLLEKSDIIILPYDGFLLPILYWFDLTIEDNSGYLIINTNGKKQGELDTIELEKFNNRLDLKSRESIINEQYENETGEKVKPDYFSDRSFDIDFNEEEF
jgi:hypothetical protein